MAFCVMICMELFKLNGGLALGVYSFIGVLVYSVSCFVLWLLAGKPPGLEERVFRLIRNRLSVMT